MCKNIVLDTDQNEIVSHVELPRAIPWDQMSGVHPGSTLTTLKPCQHNNKFGCSHTVTYSIYDKR